MPAHEKDDLSPHVLSCPEPQELQCADDVPSPSTDGVEAAFRCIPWATPAAGSVSIALTGTSDTGGMGCVGGELVVMHELAAQSECGHVGRQRRRPALR